MASVVFHTTRGDDLPFELSLFMNTNINYYSDIRQIYKCGNLSEVGNIKSQHRNIKSVVCVGWEKSD